MELPIKVALYEDSAALRCSLSNMLLNAPLFELMGAYANATQALENCQYRRPDVILMDIEIPGISGIDAVARLRSSLPEIKILMLTVFDDILEKTDPFQILEAIKEAHEGGAPMSPSIAIKVLKMFRLQAPSRKEKIDLNEREREVLTLLTRGYSYKMIAAETGLSIDTIQFHIKKIYEKLHVHSMTEAVSMALKNKWV